MVSFFGPCSKHVDRVSTREGEYHRTRAMTLTYATKV